MRWVKGKKEVRGEHSKVKGGRFQMQEVGEQDTVLETRDLPDPTPFSVSWIAWNSPWLFAAALLSAIFRRGTKLSDPLDKGLLE